MSNLEIKQGENKFYIGDDENHALAEITYRFVDNNEINIDHTGV
ncbi:N-acetyltransferase, partial [Staphylococcus aureus]|nr:N-acetyltransferase [Staphylococcus aureus]